MALSAQEQAELNALNARAAPQPVQTGLTPAEQFELDSLNKRYVQQQYGGPLQTIGAAGLGALRGASFGLSDQALVKSGVIDKEALKGFQEANPIASVGGELTGVVAPALIGDEASLANLPGVVSKLGGAAERGVLKALPEAASGARAVLTRGAAKAAGMGAEGAVYGLGQSISENALGEHDLVSQKTLSNIGISAALVGGLGALAGSGLAGKALLDESSGASKLAAEKIAQESVPGSVEEAIAKSTMPADEKMSFFESLKKRKANADEIEAAGQEIGAPVTPAQLSDSEVVQRAADALSKMPTIPGLALQNEIKKGFEAVENTIKDTLKTDAPLSYYDAGVMAKEQLQNKVDQIYKPLEDYYAKREALGQTINLADEKRLKLYDNLVEMSQNYGSVGSKGSQVIRDYAERALSQNTLTQMDKLVTEVGNDMRAAYRAGDTNTATALGKVSDALKEFSENEVLRQAKALEKQGAESGLAIGKDIVSSHKEITKQYKEFKELLQDLISDQKLGRKAKTYGGFQEALQDIPNEKFIDKIFDPKNSDGLKRLKTQFPDAWETIVQQKKAQILHEATKDGHINVGKVIKELMNDKKISKQTLDLMFSPQELKKLDASKVWLESLPKNFNPSGTASTLAYQDLLTLNPVKLLEALGKNFIGYVGNALIRGIVSPAEAERLITLSKIQKESIKSSAKISSSIKDILSQNIGSLTIKGITKSISQDDYEKRVKQIQSHANNMDNMVENIGNQTAYLQKHAPMVAQDMQTTMSRAMAFLNSKIPDHGLDSPFEPKFEPSKMEIAQFNRYYDIVDNPISALEHVKNGTFTPEIGEALGAVYPRLYQHMQAELLSAATEHAQKEPLDYQTKQSISMFLGVPLDKALNPMTIQSLQAHHVAANAQQQNMDNAAMGKTSLKGMREMKLAQSYKVQQPRDV